ncbi:MAG: alcohol dehydrogenase catalytic domain-containing protein [Nitrospinales bacterium]
MPIAAVLTAKGKFEIQERPKLEVAPRSVLIEVEHAGICGTDLSLFSGDYPIPLPHVCGHEFTGVVTSVKDAADEKWLGKKVTAEINNTCQTIAPENPCKACSIGMSSHCLKRTVTGIINKDGAFAEEIVIPSVNLHAIPDDLDPLVATLAEPMAAALQTFAMTPVEDFSDKTIVVLGPGRLGILIVFAAHLKGLNVIAVSRSEHKRERAMKYGAIGALTPDEAEEAVKEKTSGLGADIVVDATGNPDGFTTAMSLVRPRGIISAKTTCGLPVTGLDMTKLVVDEIQIQGSRCGPFPPAIEILLQHQSKLRELITLVRPLPQAQAAIELAFHEDKVILEM